MEPELTPTSLGELLRRARAVQGLTLAQVEQETRIRRRFLEALEADDLSQLPAPVFTRGLVRAYAGFLGVDQIEAAELLNKEEARHESVGVRPTVTQPASVAPAGPAGLPVRAGAVALALALLGVAVGVSLPRYGVFLVPATAVAQAGVVPDASPSARAISAPSPTLALQPTPTARPTPVPSPTAVPPPTLAPAAQGSATAAASQRGVTIEAKALGRVWMQVEADGQVTFSGIVMPGDRKVWRAERRLALYVGDGSLVDVTYNGLALGQLGPKGEVAKQDWTASR